MGSSARACSLLLALSTLQPACGGTTSHGPTTNGADANDAGGPATSGQGGETTAGRAGANASAGTGGAPTVVGCSFEDPVLARAVAATVGDPATADQLAQVKTLAVNHAKSLRGIDCLPNLRDLISTDGELTDISPLALLPQLRNVQVARNHIQDLAPLSANLELQQLEAASNEIQTLQGLTLPAPRACSELVLELNPLDAADVAFACDAGWWTTWGGTLQDRQSCNAPCLK